MGSWMASWLSAGSIHLREHTSPHMVGDPALIGSTVTFWASLLQSGMPGGCSREIVGDGHEIAQVLSCKRTCRDRD